MGIKLRVFGSLAAMVCVFFYQNYQKPWQRDKARYWVLCHSCYIVSDNKTSQSSSLVIYIPSNSNIAGILPAHMLIIQCHILFQILSVQRQDSVIHPYPVSVALH